MKQLAIFLLILASLSCGKKKSVQPVSQTEPPPPPTNLLIGEWIGTLTMDFDGLTALTNDSIHLKIFADSLILRIWQQNHDDRYKVDSLKMNDPNISFQKTLNALQVGPGNVFITPGKIKFSATRFGDLLGGSAITTASSGPLKGFGGWTTQRK